MPIIDRRLNPGGKSLENKERFLRRHRQEIVNRVLGKRTAGDKKDGHDVDITDLVNTQEPRFTRSGGTIDRVLPGNKKFIQGDVLPRPNGSGGQGNGNSQSPGKGEEEPQPITIHLSREEFINLLLDDLELPDAYKKAIHDVASTRVERAGYSKTGSPTRIDPKQTMINAFGRRKALGRPSPQAVEQLEREIEQMRADGRPEGEIQEKLELLASYDAKKKAVAFIDPLDIRYRRFEAKPKPTTKAVMFCLMDVSGSVTEEMKQTAMRFYALLEIFLEKKYGAGNVQVVYLRHTNKAEEVDHDTFFYASATGLTLVSAGLKKMGEVIQERFSPTEWNIYAAQASDGDNESHDGEECKKLMKGLLQVCQYFAYIELGNKDAVQYSESVPAATSLWATYEAVKNTLKGTTKLAMKKISDKTQVVEVFRDLFRKQDGNTPSSHPTQAAALNFG